MTPSLPGAGSPGHRHDSSSDDCVEFVDRIVYLVDNELDDADVIAVRVHIEDCRPCHERYDVQRTVKSVVARSCSERAPSALRAKIMVSLQQVEIGAEGEPGSPGLRG